MDFNLERNAWFWLITSWGDLTFLLRSLSNGSGNLQSIKDLWKEPLQSLALSRVYFQFGWKTLMFYFVQTIVSILTQSVICLSSLKKGWNISLPAALSLRPDTLGKNALHISGIFFHESYQIVSNGKIYFIKAIFKTIPKSELSKLLSPSVGYGISQIAGANES